MGLVVHMYRGPRKSLFGTFIALWFSLRLHGALPHTPNLIAHRHLHAFVISLYALLVSALARG